jgi:hypothetical protein
VRVSHIVYTCRLDIFSKAATSVTVKISPMVFSQDFEMVFFLGGLSEMGERKPCLGSRLRAALPAVLHG